jgi:hypothetical protein
MTTADAPPTWLDACARFGSAHGVGHEILDDLRAFAVPWPRGGPPPPPEAPWRGDFASLEAAWPAPLDRGPVGVLLAQEADGEQARLFARRAGAVEDLLARLGSPAARVLRVGLRLRLAGICASPPPRLRRVRALADFYFSLAARLRHPEWAQDGAGWRRLLPGLAWRRVGEGVEHAVLDGRGQDVPVHVNLLRVDPARVSIRAADVSAATRAGTGFAQATGPQALAAISGGYFLYSEDDIVPPSRRHDAVGLLLRDGRVESPPVFARAALLVGPRGEVALRVVRPSEVAVRIAGRSVAVERAWNRAGAWRAPDVEAVAIVGHEVVACGRALPVPLNGFVAVLADGAATRVRAGDPVAYAPPHVGAVQAVTGIAGGPMLVRAGVPVLDMRGEDFWGSAPPVTLSQDETGDRNLLGRMALGLDARGRLLAAAVDGRNVHRALGLTLGETARLMIRLGCHTALNLDGGSSKRMLVEGRVVDLPSTEIVAGETDPARVRPVHSALVFAPRGDAS